jgi:hypothetical protein
MPAVDTAKQQAHIDSVVNAFLDTQKATLQKTCDDQIMQAAQDSAKIIIEKEKKGIHHVAHVAKKVETKPVVAPNTNQGKKTDANAAAGTNGGKKTEANAAQGVNMGKKHN